MAADDGIKITIEGNEYDLEEFELGDLEWLEEYLDTTLDDARALRSMKAAVAFVYLIKRRDDPEFTIEQARKTKLTVFDEPQANGNGASAKPKRPTRAAKSAAQ